MRDKQAGVEVAFAATAGRHASCSGHECGAQSGAIHTSTSRVGWRLTGGECRVARRGVPVRAHPARRAPRRAPRSLPVSRPPPARRPAALSRRTARRFLSPHAVASFSPLPHFRPPSRLCRLLNGQCVLAPLHKHING
ncbi:unnamed protein product [Colias eurytheme]|nr:unnamed protein product [Colias eurytheme]